MSDHEHGQPQGAAQRANEVVEFVGRDIVQIGSRLVEKQDFRIEGEGARQRRALGHAAR